MVSRNVARRYAKGLLDAAIDAGESADERQVSEQLNGISRVVESHDGLQLVLINPAIGWENKASILSEIADQLRLHKLLESFLSLLAEKERLDHLHLIAEVFAAMVDEHRGVVTAEISTPLELDEPQSAAVKDRLSTALGRDVQLKTKTEPELLGGLVTRIGDVVYDGSLRSHLARIRRRLGSA
jgi:F-type H+-transporting ATPase subunit delta